ncbi:DUF4286 family protein [Pseudofrankia asymbiotica]|uniref:DUF4286 domain-containing protein n=1 Tax=Pseudofrankia asymbiotica TaxID=1834516 RepID=A0A1V2I2S2_9ACTN|nr:DUF4286 family protein [Pseudofrankia asymbiotica]ONH24631.1 hypothetical protein BL253_29610 [Pseudofrankia asymbiotica]
MVNEELPHWILHVESSPVSRDLETLAEFNRWYDEVHIPEMVAFEGYLSGRRLEPVDDDGPYIAQYLIEGDPEEVLGRVKAASASGELKMSETLRMSPTPKMRLMRVSFEYTKPAA